MRGKSNGVLTDSIIQEIDIKTGLVMWEWHALGHIPLSESNNPVPKYSYPWDYVHINSISPGPIGRRAAVRRATRGRCTTSTSHSGADPLAPRRQRTRASSSARARAIYWQHDAEWQPDGLISVFDNGSTPPKEKQSRGLLLKPDTAGSHGPLVKAFTNPSRTLLAASQGNTLSLPGGDWLMGYGGLPNFTEYDASGHVLLDGTLGKNVQDFRTYLAPWSGQPPGGPRSPCEGRPAARARRPRRAGTARPRCLAGACSRAPRSGALAPVATAAKAGFETTIKARRAGPYVAVQALDGSGNVLGTSATVKA